MSSRSGRRTYWCMDCNLYAVPGPYQKCEDCGGDGHVDYWQGRTSLFSHAPARRGTCPECGINESRVTGPECLDCYFSPGGIYETRPAPAKKPARPVYPIPAPEDEMTYHPRHAPAAVTA